MGSGQSSDDSENATQRAPVVKASYYELLEVDRQATDDEIKRAYRRKALELHPDRNYGSVEHATALFAEVQSAYEVLSDPQERAWYDSHEDAILRDVDPSRGGGAPGDNTYYERSVGLTTADEITRMFSRFHGGVEFSDSPSGFYGFLRETFAKLAGEEERAAQQEGVDVPDYPSFGHKEDRHEDVVKAFYVVWTGFSTKKTFSWRDKYNTRGVADRRTRRLIEKENRKFRDDAIREFNDAVRSLVAFVRKRDPRFKPNTQSEAERQKVLREAAAAQAARQRAANAAKIDADAVPEWAKARDPEELQESEGEESDEEHFECIVCRKVFKSEKQFEAHEKSKKHTKAVHSLRRKLQKEGVELELNEDADTDSVSQEAEQDDPGSHDQSEVKFASQADGANATSDDETDVADKLNDMGLDDTGITSAASGEAPRDDDSTWHEEEINSKEIDRTMASDMDLSDDDRPSTAVDADNTEPSSTPEQESLPKLGKAAQKRAKKAAQNAAALGDQSQHRCVVCNAAFPSKTRLFQHIKDFGHAAPVPAAKTKSKKAKGR